MFGKGSKNNGKSATRSISSNCIIYAHDVVKTYHTGTEHVRALNSVNFAVERGEMVAIMGPSGCGKTTLLNCLSGLDNVDSGQIWLEGKDLATMSDRARTTYRAKRMGFIFQVYNLLSPVPFPKNFYHHRLRLIGVVPFRSGADKPVSCRKARLLPNPL